MITQNQTSVTIVIARQGSQYFYWRKGNDGETLANTTIGREQAQTIILNNPDGRTTQGDLDFSDQGTPKGWQWEVAVQ